MLSPTSNGNSPKNGSFLRGLLDILKDNLGTALPILVGILGFFGFYLTPLKDYTFHRIYHESIEMKFFGDSTVYEGDDFNIDVILFPKTNIGISDGVLSLAYDSSIARSDENGILVPRSDSAASLKPIRFQALRPGQFAITGSLKTRYGEYTAKKELTIKDESSRPQISEKSYRESIELRVFGDSIVYEGDEFTIDVFILPKTNNGISDGVLSFEYDQSIARSNRNGLLVPKSEGAASLGPFRFQALRSGHFSISASLKTRYGEYANKKEVIIKDEGIRQQISENNFTGTWNLRFDNRSGKMYLVDIKGDLAGHYYVDGVPQKTTISGIRDGSAFRVDLFRNAVSKWSIDGFWEKKNRFIEIRGRATLLIIEGDNWVKRGESKEFYAVAQIGTAVRE